MNNKNLIVDMLDITFTPSFSIQEDGLYASNEDMQRLSSLLGNSIERKFTMFWVNIIITSFYIQVRLITPEFVKLIIDEVEPNQCKPFFKLDMERDIKYHLFPDTSKEEFDEFKHQVETIFENS